MLRKLSFIVISLIVLLNLSASSYAQFTNNYSEQVGAVFPISSATENAQDYRGYMVTTTIPQSSHPAMVNYFGIFAGVPSIPLNTFMHAGLYVTSAGVTWFAAGNPGYANAPDIICLRGNEEWFDPNGRHTGCLGNVGDLGLDINIWTRVQFVTYGNGFWIVRITNVQGHKIEVQKYITLILL